MMLMASGTSETVVGMTSMAILDSGSRKGGEGGGSAGRSTTARCF